MIFEVNQQQYRQVFREDPNPFISIPFIILNSRKADKLVFLINKKDKGSIGLIGGIKGKSLLSPFSAPFGGFHYRSEKILYSEVEEFIQDLRIYSGEHEIQKIEIILPPVIYGQTINAKVVNALIRNGFSLQTPDIANYGYLNSFKDQFSDRKSGKSFRQALKHGLIFHEAKEWNEKAIAYDIILKNRIWMCRPMSMNLKEILQVSELWPVDFFKVTTSEGEGLAAAIIYRSHPGIAHVSWWGDNERGRSLRAMDFITNNLWKYYKNLGYQYLDLGTSTVNGIPNTGLLRFKESLDAFSSLRFKFIWESS